MLLLLITGSCSGSKKIFSSLEKELDVPALNTGFNGLAVYDPELDRMIFEHNSSKHFTPASNIKLLTFYAGIKTLVDSVPGIFYRVSGDSLIFSGTGDPSFLNPKFPGSPVLDFLKDRSENLFFQPVPFNDPPLGPGWAWDDYNYGFSAEKDQFPIYGNTVRFIVSGNDLKVQPSIFQDSITYNPASKSGPNIKRELHRNQFSFTPGMGSEKDTLEIPFLTSNRLLIQLLQDTLQRKIVLLPEKKISEEKKVVFSIPTDSLYKRMLQESDNLVAEQLLLMVSQKLTDTLSSKTAINYLKMEFLDDLPDEVKWVDGSGLSRYNLATPRSMVALLKKIKNEVPQKELFSLLPTGGRSGTLKKQFKNQEPFVFAKTGSMSNNYSLSGFLRTKQGKILIFSIMNSNFTVPSSEIRTRTEQLLEILRDYK
ncbi:D-alanyl-D-alanine carboxypeptidase/D-alanyl-D-alanine-endopeptidase [Actinomadura fibrosa]